MNFVKSAIRAGVVGLAMLSVLAVGVLVTITGILVSLVLLAGVLLVLPFVLILALASVVMDQEIFNEVVVSEPPAGVEFESIPVE